MPAEVEAPDRAPVQVKVSATNELVFALYVIHRAVHRPGSGWSQTWVPPLMESHAETAARVGKFWTDGFPEWPELLLFAEAAGRLWDTDADQLLAQLPELTARGVRVPEFPAEAPEVRPIIAGRVERLGADAGLRQAYSQLMKDVWDVLRPHWNGGARGVAERMADDFRRRLAKVADFRDLLPVKHFARREMHQPLVDEALRRGEVVLVPLALAGVGVGFFSLSSCLIVAQGPEAASGASKHREEAERVAARFKLLSDPTRLSILGTLIECSYSITDLAEVFELSQPTISVHVKQLREAGLLDSQKVRGQMVYRASRERIQELVLGAIAEMGCAI